MELAYYLGPAAGGLLNATFGNATEFIIAAFALHAGLIEVVKASLTGSIIANLLLVLGTAILAGGLKHKPNPSANATAAKASGSTLLVAVIALVTSAVSLDSSADPATSIQQLSVIVSCLMIVIYAASLLFAPDSQTPLRQIRGN